MPDLDVCNFGLYILSVSFGLTVRQSSGSLRFIIIHIKIFSDKFHRMVFFVIIRVYFTVVPNHDNFRQTMTFARFFFENAILYFQ